MADLPLPRPLPIDRGVTGSSERVDVERRRAREEQKVRQRLRAAMAGRVVRERRLGRLFDRELEPVAIVLHDRQVPELDDAIDHVIVASSGVWVVDARHERGRVRRGHRLGRSAEPSLRLPSGVRTPLVDRSGDHVDLVRGYVDRVGFEWMDVQRAVCLTNAGWGVHPRPFRIDGDWVIWGRALVAKVAVPGPVGPAEMHAVAAELSARLPAGR